jgi:hypothetical protein
LAEILAQNPDLTQIVNAWPELPKHIKSAIKALAKAHHENQ